MKIREVGIQLWGPVITAAAIKMTGIVGYMSCVGHIIGKGGF